MPGERQIIIHLFYVVWVVAVLPVSDILGRIPQTQVGEGGPRIPSTQPILEGKARRPLPTMEKDGVTVYFVYIRS